MNSSNQWKRVSRDNPCPICGKPDNCNVSASGEVVWCGRISEGSLRENAGGQYLHRLKDDWRPPLVSVATQNRRKSEPRDYSGLASRLFAAGGEDRQRLSELLGVRESALTELQVGWNSYEHYWSFPERDGHGKVVGINARHLNGDKKRLPGCRTGLTYADGWDVGHGPVLLVEGGSDTAAMLGIGLNVVGRPSNVGGVADLINLLSRLNRDREIVVIGERDEKSDGRWPGRDGAVRTAEKLSDGLQRRIGWSLPPDNAKDARAWLLAMPKLPDDRLRALFLSGLDTTDVDPPPRFSMRLPASPGRGLSDWRESMLQARLEVLDRPGCYLDASMTGSGKSYVDYATLVRAFTSEAL